MAPKIIQPPQRGGGDITTASGLVLPPSMHKSSYAVVPGKPGSQIAYLQSKYMEMQQTGWNRGTQLKRDPDTMIPCWPEKYSGFDDYTMGEIIDGNVANVGLSPVVSSLMSTAVLKQVAQVSNADITLTGRASPTKKARDAISWWNDSPTGVVSGLATMAYQLLVYNRGAPLATVPLIYPFDKWEEYGLIAHPMPAKGQKSADSMYWWLEVDWEKHGQPVPFLPSVFDLEPTESQEWPYWYRVKIGDKYRWILLHHTQIITVLPGVSQRTGFGTSPTWLLTEPLGIYIIAQDGKAENLVNAPTTGMIGISGTEEEPSAIKKRMEEDRKRAAAGGNYFDKSPFIIVSPDKELKFVTFSFRNLDAWKEEDIQRFEDRVATNYRMSLNELGISRKGVGYAGQAQNTSSLSADSGAGYILSLVGSALGRMFPRVQVATSRPNDLARQRQLEDFAKLASAVKDLPDGTLEREEIRAMIEGLVNIMIPATTDAVTTSPGSDDSTDVQPSAQENQALHAAIDAMLLEAYNLQHYAPVSEVLTQADAKNFWTLVKTALDKQYRSANVEKIVGEIRKAGIDLEDEFFGEKALPIVQKHTRKVKQFANLPAMLTALDAIRVEGRREAEEQGSESNADLTIAQRQTVDRNGKAALGDRLNELFVKATGDPGSESDSLPLDDQRARHTLDKKSYEEITALIWAAMWDNVEIPAIKSAYLASVDVTWRANLVLDIEGARAYNIGFSQTGEKLQALKKRWEETISINPREKHLAIVGQVVGINERFSTGDKWAGELYGCKCGITLLWE